MGTSSTPQNLQVYGTVHAARYLGERPIEPIDTGVYLGIDPQNNASIEICSGGTTPYIDLTGPYGDYAARIAANLNTGNCEITCSGELRVNGAPVLLNGGVARFYGSKPVIPNDEGVYLGLDAAGAGGVEVCAASVPYIDLTTPGTDFVARIQADPATGNCEIFCGGQLRVNGAAVGSSSDPRLAPVTYANSIWNVDAALRAQAVEATGQFVLWDGLFNATPQPRIYLRMNGSDYITQHWNGTNTATVMTLSRTAAVFPGPITSNGTAVCLTDARAFGG